ncbi:MAG: DNA repair protein RadC [Candidatus Aenigmarchaeota archaeon]|nr:DNA repair protein RadC [Candidatus Aenigmarchaeota archaeon]
MQCKLMLKDMQRCEMPRERLLKYGPEALSLSELLAIIIRCGTRDENVLDLSRRILSEFDISQLQDITVGQIKKFKGIKNAKAAQIIAVFEIAKRVSTTRQPFKLKIENSKDIRDYLMPKMKNLKKEHLIGLYLDTRNNLIKEETISIGTLNSSLIHPREIFRSAVIEACASVILVHNHPSGDPTPSKDDITVTKKIIQASEVIGIELLDHVIIGNERYVSLKEDGLI